MFGYPDETLSLVFDILRQTSVVKSIKGQQKYIRLRNSVVALFIFVQTTAYISRTIFSFHQTVKLSLILLKIFSNYWMTLRRIWRIVQIKEGVIHRGRRPKWITPSEICRILHILRKPNSIIALLFIQNIYSFFKRSFVISLFVFPLTLSPGFRGQWFNNLQRAALLTSFWRQWFNNFWRAPLLTSLIQYGEDSFQIWWTAAGYGELSLWF